MMLRKRMLFVRTTSGNATQIGATARIPDALDRLIALDTATKHPDEVKKYTDLRATFPAKK